MFGDNNFIVRFWRGGYSLGVSFWVVYIGFTLVFHPLVKAASNLVLSTHAYDPRLSLTWICFTLVVTYTLAVVQWVGVWRAARNGRERKHAAGRRPAWSYIAQAAMVLSVLNVARLAVMSTRLTLIETYKMAFAGDPAIPAFTMRVTPDGTQILVFGGFKFGLTAEFLRLTAPLSNLRTVHLASAGGRAGEAKHLYEVIKAKGLDTYVSDICYSACTIAFAGGKRRYLLKTGKLGFHSESFLGKAIDDEGPYGERRAYIDAGFAPALIEKTLATPPSQMWKPTQQALIDDHVITDIATSDQFAASDMGVAPTAAKIEGRDQERVPSHHRFRHKPPGPFRRAWDRTAEILHGGRNLQGLRSTRQRQHRSRLQDPFADRR